MSVQTIRVYPDSVLRKKSLSVDEISDRVRRLADDLIHTLTWANGVGLAAPQIGELLRVVAIDFSVVDGSKKPLCMINPEIVEEEGLEVAEEGCLSIPGIYENLERPSTVLVKGIDVKGRCIELELHDILARAISHEIDHLDGILFIDRISPLRRTLLRSKLKNLKEDKNPQHSQSL
jgi:peptide deformylase